jgi:hypothetical protein
MNLQLGVSAIVALAASSFAAADTIHVGRFVNTGGGAISYQGGFSPFISTSFFVGPDLMEHTLIHVNVSAMLASVGASGLSSATITDTGDNAYTQTSPGADIDLFTFSGLPGDASVSYLYEGPNAFHTGESAAAWANRVAAVDSFSGSQDIWHMTQLSLAAAGRVTAYLSQPGGYDGDNGGDDNDGDPDDSGGGIIITPPLIGNGSVSSAIDPLMLSISEHGVFEAFTLEIEAFTVPAPGAMGLLALGGFASRRRRG